MKSRKKRSLNEIPTEVMEAWMWLKLGQPVGKVIHDRVQDTVNKHPKYFEFIKPNIL